MQELFAELMKGSLATYLNALTYPDRTVFPTASTNLQARRVPFCCKSRLSFLLCMSSSS